jgi:hypothetical protein
MAKPGIERLLFLPVGFEPATVGSKELYATTERSMVKVSIYIHRTQGGLPTPINWILWKKIRKSIFGSLFFGSLFSEVNFSEVNFRKSIFGNQFSEVYFRKSIFRKSIFRKSILGS